MLVLLAFGKFSESECLALSYTLVWVHQDLDCGKGAKAKEKMSKNILQKWKPNKTFLIFSWLHHSGTKGHRVSPSQFCHFPSQDPGEGTGPVRVIIHRALLCPASLNTFLSAVNEALLRKVLHFLVFQTLMSSLSLCVLVSVYLCLSPGPCPSVCLSACLSLSLPLSQHQVSCSRNLQPPCSVCPAPSLVSYRPDLIPFLNCGNPSDNKNCHTPSILTSSKH